MRCPICNRTFDPADRVQPGAQAGAEVQVKYCSEACARKAENRRYYAAHKQTIIKRVRKNQRRARKE